MPGAGLRLRLLLFFILISVLSAGPQAMLGITFVNSAMGTWFSSSIGDALRGARDLAIAYQNERMQEPGLVHGRPARPAPRRGLRGLPRAARGREIQAVNPSIGALQLFSADGRELAFRGDARARGLPARWTPAGQRRTGRT